MTAGGVSSSFMTARLVTLLPLPLSPTMAAHSPSRTCRLTPSTARTTPEGPGKITFKLSTASAVLSVMAGSAFL